MDSSENVGKQRIGLLCEVVLSKCHKLTFIYFSVLEMLELLDYASDDMRSDGSQSHSNVVFVFDHKLHLSSCETPFPLVRCSLSECMATLESAIRSVRLHINMA